MQYLKKQRNIASHQTETSSCQGLTAFLLNQRITGKDEQADFLHSGIFSFNF